MGEINISKSVILKSNIADASQIMGHMVGEKRSRKSARNQHSNVFMHWKIYHRYGSTDDHVKHDSWYDSY